ncbi:MAG: beta-ketoacyl synthase N-terminal-like domain-containing protein, partial [Mycobacteriaceae bacterium]
MWEAQLDVLFDFLEKSSTKTPPIEVLFAGGIHDERSATMVSVMAAPLCALGLRIGILMGTAYLFTEEAVSAGAVGTAFQQQVIAASRTSTLETAPGHVTRCVESPFTEEFESIRDTLRSNNIADREIWETLEKLNVGRLRLASKGIERIGDDLFTVDEQRQRSEGMFMAGEVAVLRNAPITIDSLHASVTTKAAGYFTERCITLLRQNPNVFADQKPLHKAPDPLDIAIVGMSAIFPGAPDLESYWANIVSGKDSVTEVSTNRWDPAVYYSPDGDGTKTSSKWGGFLPEIDFDPLRFGIPPSSLSNIEPVQLLALEAADRALAHAGYSGKNVDKSRISVIFGAEAGSDLSNATTLRSVLPAYLNEVPEEVMQQLPKLTEDSFPGMLANVISGRVANRLDLGGANYTVDAACASSLTAVDVACKELVNGTSDVVLCGGADMHNGINDFLLFSSVHALSPTGRSATFDSSADGIALGEGVACVVLKRLADAERDGDTIYSVIKGVGSASDGRSLGLTAPRPEGQFSAVTRAYENAQISPAQVGLIEAHGTGTVVGDRTELSTLTKVFLESNAQPGTTSIGSVKSQIGHTKCAAGLAGLVKAALALHTGIKPPTLHITSPNSAWDASTSPFIFHTAAQPWAQSASERIAGVSAFGFGGTNFHVVMRAYDGAPPPAQTLSQWPYELITFRGTNHEQAIRSASQLLSLTNPAGNINPWRLKDLALAAARQSDVRASRGEKVQIAIVADSVEQLAASLQRAISGEENRNDGIFRASVNDEETKENSVAFLFPGQGSQAPGMFAELFTLFPELADILESGQRWSDILYPPAAFDAATRQEQARRLTDTRIAQPTLGMVGIAAFRLMVRAGVQPAMLAGHSYGELVALSAAGVFNTKALLDTSSARANAILNAIEDDPGTMAAISASTKEISKVLAEQEVDSHIVLANQNSPSQTVISGSTKAIDTALVVLKNAGISGKKIPVACAFHSPLVASAANEFGAFLDAIDFQRAEIPVWSNRTASQYPQSAPEVRAELCAQIGSPVRFTDQVLAMYEAGARIFVETGPGSVLSKLVKAILGDRPFRTITFDSATATGLKGYLHALAELSTAGVDIRTAWMFRGRQAVDASTATAAKQVGWTVDGQLVRTKAGDIPAGALRPAERISLSHSMTPTYVASGPHPGSAESMVTDFLRSSREMIAAQRDVLMSYLGTEAARALPPIVATPTHSSSSAGLVDPPSSVSVAPVTQVGSTTTHTPESILATIVDIIGTRTGYPTDMIEPDL